MNQKGEPIRIMAEISTNQRLDNSFDASYEAHKIKQHKKIIFINNIIFPELSFFSYAFEEKRFIYKEIGKELVFYSIIHFPECLQIWTEKIP